MSVHSILFCLPAVNQVQSTPMSAEADAGHAYVAYLQNSSTNAGGENQRYDDEIAVLLYRFCCVSYFYSVAAIIPKRSAWSPKTAQELIGESTNLANQENAMLAMAAMR